MLWQLLEQHLSTLFPDSVLKQAEEDISASEKGRSVSTYKKNRFHPYERPETKPDNRLEEPLTWP